MVGPEFHGSTIVLAYFSLELNSPFDAHFPNLSQYSSDSRSLQVRRRRPTNLAISNSFKTTAKFAATRCTKSCHVPVNGLHSIENTSLTNQNFSLTPKLE